MLFPSLQRPPRYNRPMHIDLDIIVYAVIAVVLVARLWSVLGNKNEDDPQRPNPFGPPPDADASFSARTPAAAPSAPALSFRAAPPPTSLAGGLAQIKTADASFDEKQFLQQARASFTAIVEAYAAGTFDGVADKMSPALLAHFQQAADARRAAGQSAQTRILKIDEAEVTAAHADETKCFATVTFTSTQENTLFDAAGKTIGGGTGTAETVTDVWTFTRDAQTPDSAWVVTETRG
ncbi:MAG: Tim44 domain-containing protein [Alphaproteobacteria bacterium]|nr:Tim44 domain-containing protein [Alphaproteobacteria bacterium]